MHNLFHITLQGFCIKIIASKELKEKGKENFAIKDEITSHFFKIHFNIT
jgi:hypothetical protein